MGDRKLILIVSSPPLLEKQGTFARKAAGEGTIVPLRGCLVPYPERLPGHRGWPRLGVSCGDNAGLVAIALAQALQQEQWPRMWKAIVEHAQTISGIGTAVMATIWLVYLQVFLLQFRRQRRAFLVIHHARGLSPSASCLLVNMSQETVHVQCVIARVTTKQGEYVRQLADLRRPSADEEEVEGKLREGPLQPGGYVVLGDFEEIILDTAADAKEESSREPSGEDAGGRSEQPASQRSDEDLVAGPPSSLSEVESLELCAAVVHGPSNHPIGARRRFSVEAEDRRFLIRPQNIHTEQLTNFRKRRQVRRWVEQCLEPQQGGAGQTLQSEQSSP